MLKVARIADRTGRYYLDDLALELQDTSLERAGTPASGRGGRWIGTGAAGLGLYGPVAAGPFEAVLSGRHPYAGHPLRARATALAAYDLTFAAPKSASVLFGLAPPAVAAQVRAAHEDAVDATMTYVATRAASVRRGGCDGRSPGPVGGVVAASFTHGVSRALEPHLHSHVVVANLARGDDGRWRALDGRGIYAHAQAIGALYDAALRQGITARLGLEWAPRQPLGWELAAIDPVLLGAFSSRRADILARLDARRGSPGTRFGSPSPRSRQLAWVTTRDPKPAAHDARALRARWEATAHDAGAPLALVGDRSVPPSPSLAHDSVDEHRFAAAVAGDGRRAVARRDALAAWAQALPAGDRPENIERCVDALCDWGSGTGVAEGSRGPAAVIPSPHVLRALGPRPTSPDRLEVWQSAAATIATYRTRWEVQDRWRPLGAGTRAELATMPARRLADHLAATRAVREARSRLGRARELDRRLDASRHLTRDAH